MPYYPPVEPYETGHLAVDGQELYWEQVGNPAGRPALVLHGGPGAGCTPGMRRSFDPAHYRVVLVDQRGAGRSRPHAADSADLSGQTTARLVADLEAVRARLGVEQWLVHGASWGSTLAVAYAVAHPDRVSAAVLAAVTLTRPSEVAWFTRGAGRFFPEHWDRFRAGAGVAADDDATDLAAAYASLIADPDPTVRRRAVDDWWAWEDALVSLERGRTAARYADPRFRLGFARLTTHFFAQAAGFGERDLLDGAAALAHVPAVLIHGRLDLSGPLTTAWELSRAWPGSELVVLDDAGHTSTGIGAAIVAATDRLRTDRVHRHDRP